MPSKSRPLNSCGNRFRPNRLGVSIAERRPCARKRLGQIEIGEYRYEGTVGVVAVLFAAEKGKGDPLGVGGETANLSLRAVCRPSLRRSPSPRIRQDPVI